MSEVIKPVEQKHDLVQLAEIVGGVAFLYVVANFGFNHNIKERVFEKQGGLSPIGEPIEEYHHIVPFKALRKIGLKGKNCEENCVGLSKVEHKTIWDRLMMKGTFYPGVPIEDVDPKAYVKLTPKKGKHKRRH